MMHNTKRILLTAFLTIFYLVSWSKENPLKEEKDVKKCIEQLFNGMRAGDSSMVSAILHPDIRMQTIATKDGKTILKEGSAEIFLNAIGTPHEKVWDERIFSYEMVD